jgi:hypothetical protein
VERVSASEKDKKLLAAAYGNRSWHDLLLGDFNGAIDDAKKGLGYDNKEIWILTNEAHGLLFTGRIDEARKIYLEYAAKATFPDNPNSKVTFCQTVFADFDQLKGRAIPGIDLAAMNDAMKDLLKERSTVCPRNPGS